MLSGSDGRRIDEEDKVDERNSDFETAAARRSSDGQTGTPTTYIPPEVRPDPQPSAPHSGAPTQPQPEAPQWTQPGNNGSAQTWAPPPPAQEQPVRTYGPTVVREQRRNGPPIVGPILLIGAGVLFLLNNLGIVDWGVWNDLWRLWPLILIAIGLDLLIGRRNPLISLVIILVVIGAGAAFLASTGGLRGAGNVATSEVSVPLSGATRAEVDLNFGFGTLRVDGNGQTGQLATGTVGFWQNRGTPRQDVDMSGGRIRLSLEQRSQGFTLFGGPPGDVNWDLHLSPDVPMELKANLGAGNSVLDLTQLNVTNLDVNSGAGNTTVRLPESAGALSANIDGGVGNITLGIPDGVQARIGVNSGLGNVDVDNRFTKDGDAYVTSGYNAASERVDIDLKVGVGNVEIGR
jgi:hypothetical protein